MPDPVPLLATRLQYGVSKGLKLALGFSLFAAIIVAIMGKDAGKDLPAPLLLFVGAYFACGLLGGALYGALWPPRESLPGSILAWAALFAGCGIAFILPVVMWIGVSGASLRLLVVGLVALTGAILGVVFGIFDWGRRRKKRWVPAYFVGLLLLLWIGRAVPEHANEIGALPWGPILQGVWPVVLALVIAMGVWVWQHRRHNSEA